MRNARHRDTEGAAGGPGPGRGGRKPHPGPAPAPLTHGDNRGPAPAPRPRHVRDMGGPAAPLYPGLLRGLPLLLLPLLLLPLPVQVRPCTARGGRGAVGAAPARECGSGGMPGGAGPGALEPGAGSGGCPGSVSRGGGCAGVGAGPGAARFSVGRCGMAAGASRPGGGVTPAPRAGAVPSAQESVLSPAGLRAAIPSLAALGPSCPLLPGRFCPMGSGAAAGAVPSREHRAGFGQSSAALLRALPRGFYLSPSVTGGPNVP